MLVNWAYQAKVKKTPRSCRNTSISRDHAKRQEPIMQDETTYILEPTAFHSMTEAQVLTDQLEQSLSNLSNVADNIKPQVVEMFSEMVNNAAEHGMSDTGAHCHVRLMGPTGRALPLTPSSPTEGPASGPHWRGTPTCRWNQTSRPSGSPCRNSPQAPAIPPGALASGPPSYECQNFVRSGRSHYTVGGAGPDS